MRGLILAVAVLLLTAGCGKKKPLSDKQATGAILKHLKLVEDWDKANPNSCCFWVKAKVTKRGNAKKGRHPIRAKLFFKLTEGNVKNLWQGVVECEVFKNKFSEWSAKCSKYKPVPGSRSRSVNKSVSSL